MEQSLSSVSDIVNAIKTTLEFEYADLLLEGEVSNLSLSSAGHYYFSLSDSKASLSCALFKMDALRNPFIRKIKNSLLGKIQNLTNVVGAIIITIRYYLGRRKY